MNSSNNTPRVLFEGKYQRMIVNGTWEYSERVHPGGLAAIILAVTPEERIIFVEQFQNPHTATHYRDACGISRRH